MKVIFLDIDGVLNSVESAMAMHGYERLDPVCVGLLARLVANSGAKIVVSSTWRIGHPTVESLKNRLKIAGLTESLVDAIIGMTPVRYDRHRGTEIWEWLNEHNGEVEAYVILDDDSDMHPGQIHVHTHVRCGFALQDYLAASEYLGCVAEHETGLKHYCTEDKQGWRVG